LINLPEFVKQGERETMRRGDPEMKRKGDKRLTAKIKDQFSKIKFQKLTAKTFTNHKKTCSIY